MVESSEVYNWHARQLDFGLAFPQAEVKTNIYLHVPELKEDIFFLMIMHSTLQNKIMWLK